VPVVLLEGDIPKKRRPRNPDFSEVFSEFDLLSIFGEGLSNVAKDLLVESLPFEGREFEVPPFEYRPAIYCSIGCHLDF